MKCYYHGVDADGWSSAYQVYDKYKDDLRLKGNIKDNFIPMNYTQPIDFSIVEKDETVWIVDYSLSRKSDKDALIDLFNNVTQNIIWIDHHKDSIMFEEEHPELFDETKDKYIKGIRIDNRKLSAAKLVYLYINTDHDFFKLAIEAYENNDEDTIKRIESMIPTPVLLISDHDNFVHEYPDSIKFYYGLQYCISCCEEYDVLLNNYEEMKKAISIGEIIKTHESINNEKSADDIFEININGHKCYALNKRGNSFIFREKYLEADAVMPFWFNGTAWKYSLFANLQNPNHIDCGEIARLLGGGGREGAAGFITTELKIKKDLNGNYYLDLGE